MKAYIKPELNCVDFRTEEKFASTSVCPVTGSCPDQTASFSGSDWCRLKSPSGTW